MWPSIRRFVPSVFFVAFGMGGTVVYAQPPAIEIIPAEVIAGPEAPTDQATPPTADPAWQLARLRYHIYRRHEYPLMIQRLNAAIGMAEAELAALDRQIAEFESISRPVTSHPFLVTLESARLRRLSTELRLTELRRMRQARLQTFVTEQILVQQQIASEINR